MLLRMDELVQGMDRLQHIGGKIDTLGRNLLPGNPLFHVHPSEPGVSAAPGPFMEGHGPEPKIYPTDPWQIPQKVLAWPKMTELLMRVGIGDFDKLQWLGQDGAARFLQRIEMLRHPDPLPAEPRCHTQPHPSFYGREIIVDLTPEAMRQYTEFYFASVGARFPILSRAEFDTAILPTVVQRGFGYSDSLSMTALLVFAIGKLVLEGMLAEPVTPSSGIRGGSVVTPPGLELFNEARKRTGFRANQCDLENARMHLLLAYVDCRIPAL